jgi:CheY-like chemotaxis protein
MHEPANSDTTPHAGAAGAPRKSVLVVDDDAAIRQYVKDALQESGYGVRTATDGASALAAVEVERPDLILLDVRMPGINGWGVLNELRSAAGPHCPIVIMTGQYEGQDQALASGAQGYLAKPFELDDLLESVELHVGLHIDSNLAEELPAHDQRS